MNANATYCRERNVQPMNRRSSAGITAEHTYFPQKAQKAQRASQKARKNICRVFHGDLLLD